MVSVATTGGEPSGAFAEISATRCGGGDTARQGGALQPRQTPADGAVEQHIRSPSGRCEQGKSDTDEVGRWPGTGQHHHADPRQDGAGDVEHAARTGDRDG